MAIRRCDRFRFDYFLRSCSAENLGKRCEQLMRAAEKENSEYERKRQAVDEGRKKEREDRLLEDSKREKEDEERRKRLTEIDQKLSEEEGKLNEIGEAKKVAEIRLQMLKGVKADNGDSGSVSSMTGSKVGGVKVKAEGGKGGGAASSKEPGTKGQAPKTVPEQLLPGLAAMVVKAGGDGLAKIVNEFYNAYKDSDGVSKRQIELKINELAVKEKRDEDHKPVWHLRPEFQHLYRGKPGGDAVGGSSKSDENKKRKRDLEEDAGSSGLKEPKKARNAVTLYLVDKKEQVKKELGDQATNDNIKIRIKTMWKAETPEVKERYTAMARDEDERYEREMNVYRSQLHAAGSTGSGTAPAAAGDGEVKKRPLPVEDTKPQQQGEGGEVFAIPKKMKHSSDDNM